MITSGQEDIRRFAEGRIRTVCQEMSKLSPEERQKGYADLQGELATLQEILQKNNTLDEPLERFFTAAGIVIVELAAMNTAIVGIDRVLGKLKQ